MKSNLKAIISFLFLITLFFTSCASPGVWPERTRDPELEIVGDKSHLSSKDVASVHEFIWKKNPNLRILGIEVLSKDTLLLTCTTQPGDRFTKFIGFDLLRTGDGWREGNYKSKLESRSMY